MGILGSQAKARKRSVEDTALLKANNLASNANGMKQQRQTSVWPKTHLFVPFHNLVSTYKASEGLSTCHRLPYAAWHHLNEYDKPTPTWPCALYIIITTCLSLHPF